MGINELKAFGKAFGKYVLPEEVVKDYRSQLQVVEDSVLIITLDSCRHDTFVEAYDNNFPAKNVREAYSPCNWTLPSHESIARGHIPFGDFVDPLDDKGYSRGIPLPTQHHYSFGATAMPFLSESKPLMNNLHSYFDDYYCAEQADSVDKVLEEAAEFMEEETGFFGLINLGETHSPYKDFDSRTADSIIESLESGDLSYEQVHDWQIQSAKYLIEKISEFRQHIPEGTTVIITSDHGELFGEEDGFGHNPYKKAVFHENLYKVPLIYWREP